MTAVHLGVDDITVLVRTHGTRLVRLAHVCGVDRPERVAAGALAAAQLGRGRGDVHAQLMTAARYVGARAQPPIHDEPRLQGWLDRAQLDEREPDLDELQQAVVRAVAEQRAGRSRGRRRLAAGAVAVAVALAAVSAVSGGGSESPTPGVRLSTGGVDGLRPAPDDPAAQAPLDLSGLLPSAPARLPSRQRHGTGAIGDMVLTGPASPIANVHLHGRPGTVVAVRCDDDRRAMLCLLALQRRQPIAAAADWTRLLAALPLPRGDALTGAAGPVISRMSIVDEFNLRTVLLDATSSQVGTLSVTFSDGERADAARFSIPGSHGALFVLVAADKTPAELTYLTDGMVLERRTLYTATP